MGTCPGEIGIDYAIGAPTWIVRGAGTRADRGAGGRSPPPSSWLRGTDCPRCGQHCITAGAGAERVRAGGGPAGCHRAHRRAHGHLPANASVTCPTPLLFPGRRRSSASGHRVQGRRNRSHATRPQGAPWTRCPRARQWIAEGDDHGADPRAFRLSHLDHRWLSGWGRRAPAGPSRQRPSAGADLRRAQRAALI